MDVSNDKLNDTEDTMLVLNKFQENLNHMVTIIPYDTALNLTSSLRLDSSLYAWKTKNNVTEVFEIFNVNNDIIMQHFASYSLESGWFELSFEDYNDQGLLRSNDFCSKIFNVQLN